MPPVEASFPQHQCWDSSVIIPLSPQTLESESQGSNPVPTLTSYVTWAVTEIPLVSVPKSIKLG